MATILTTIRDLMRTYVDRQKKPPNAIRLTRNNEYELMALALSELPDSVASTLFTEGPRRAFPRIFGMQVIWDAETMEVLRESDEPVGFLKK